MLGRVKIVRESKRGVQLIYAKKYLIAKTKKGGKEVMEGEFVYRRWTVIHPRDEKRGEEKTLHKWMLKTSHQEAIQI